MTKFRMSREIRDSMIPVNIFTINFPFALPLFTGNTESKSTVAVKNTTSRKDSAASRGAMRRRFLKEP